MATRSVVTMGFLGVGVTAKGQRGSPPLAGKLLDLPMAKLTGKIEVVPIFGCCGSFMHPPVINGAILLKEAVCVVGNEKGLIVFLVSEKEVSQDVGVPSAGVSVPFCPRADFL